MKNSKSILFVTKNLNIIALKKKKILKLYLFNDIFYYSLILSINSIILNSNLNCVIFEKVKYFDIINNIANNLSFIIYRKISFVGKGFKIKKNKKINNFNFNTSHIKLFIENKMKLIKNGKNVFLILSKNIESLKNLKFFLNLFKLNIFTKKGIRLNRSLVKLKKIKKK